MPVRFSAVILAGGASSRMGRDKAWIELDGHPLLRRQLDLARAAGADDLWISGRPDTDYSGLDAPVLLDRTPGLGPLAGLHRGLEAARHDLVLALAVDLARLTPDWLRLVAGHGAPGCGAVPVADGRPQPLAAFYPRAIAPRVARHLAGRRLALQALVADGVAQGELVLVSLGPEAAPAFANWNVPADLPKPPP
ncbi:MAG: molybdenum cofactor guanylyltransferase [Verrucomicrobiae bacterium]|nr:molybdenum cofactor guanylyltransferase [Verrucomicrobiae bacterium]